MQIDPKAAEASLADIDMVVGRLKQSALYRSAGLIIMVWGAGTAAANVATQIAPRSAGLIWLCASALSFLVTLLLGLRQHRATATFDWRIVIAVLLFFGFGCVFCQLGHFGWRELDTFWPIFFMLGYTLAGLWLGRAFVFLGIGVALLAYAGYVFVETWFNLYLAVVNGGGLILAGLWMRRA